MNIRLEKWVEDIWDKEPIKVRLDWLYENLEDTDMVEDLAYMDAEYMAKEYPDKYTTIMAEIEDQNSKYHK